MNEAELEVESDKASFKQKLDVLQQQEELIEDEEEQEQKEEDARRAKREEEARLAEMLLPETEVSLIANVLLPCSSQYLQLQPEGAAEADARMTTEQLKELASALSILSSKSSVLKERDELHALMEENMSAEEVRLDTLLCPATTDPTCPVSAARPKVTGGRIDEAHQIHADEDRRTIVRLRRAGRLVAANDLV